MLLEEEQASLITEIESCGDLFPLHLIQKNQILALMDCNIRVSVCLLEKALVSPLASEYFQMFTSLTPAPNSCDLVKQLFEKSLLPKEIVEMFVANALDYIRALHDVSKQSRLAQMVIYIYFI